MIFFKNKDFKTIKKKAKEPISYISYLFMYKKLIGDIGNLFRRLPQVVEEKEKLVIA